MAREPFGYTLFCDDVRQEIGGKYSLIGIYRNDLIFEGPFPAKLSKLCLIVNYEQPANLDLLPLKLKVLLDDNEFVDAAIDLPNAPIERTADENKNVGLQVVMNLADVQFVQPTKIKVRIYRDEKEIKCGTLTVSAKPSDAAEQMGLEG
jgi:hypothetical protein